MKAASVNQSPENKVHIAQTEQFVKQSLAGAEAGHDWWHIHRVYNNAKLILASEKADQLVVELAVLLHDIDDSKFNGGDEEIGPQKAGDFLRSIHVEEKIIRHVQEIIRNMSFRSGLGIVNFHSRELEIVQDADRLDAIGAIGIARAFTYGGFKNREIYNPEIPPAMNMRKEEYKNSSSPSINHFYEKLLLLKDQMNTETGRQIALERHSFMELYLGQFKSEWNGER
ncbi:HD domain-containing protein [Daejeonella sp.]|uniref:HD domain-containing protein n=1 Tax=Daejeonella sp. TaxID=2805397 RepID=UPI00398334F1